MSDTLNLANSIWPNGMKVDSDGHAVYYPLGINKVKVPTSSAQWPKGNKFVSPFVYQDDKLVGFVDTKALTVSKKTAIYLPYEHIDAEFSAIYKGRLQIHAPNATTKKVSWKNSGVEDIPEVQFKYKGYKTKDQIKADFNYDYLADIANGTWSEPLWDLERGGNGQYNGGMFIHCSNLTTFSSDLPSLVFGFQMFMGCSNLTSFNADLSSLQNGYSMFAGCANLTSFTSDLSKLSFGDGMFFHCENLTSFTSDSSGSPVNLSSLTDGVRMFAYSKLSSFTSDLSSLTKGGSMFSNCYNLTTFSSDLPSLTDGERMFNDCNNLTSFNSNLSSLTNGHGMFESCENFNSFSSDLSSLQDGSNMFNYCKLDAPSVKNIIDTINTYSGKLLLGMGCNNTAEDANLFAQEVGYSDMFYLVMALQAKGWTISTQFNGRPTTTYSMRRPSEDTLPVFVKLEEVVEYADYTSLDDSKKYRLTYFHETTGSTDGYTQFNSLEEAIESLNIKPIENQ